MIETTTVERKIWQSKPEISHRNEDKSLQIIASKSSEVEISEHLFNLIPCNSRLRYCVDVGTRNGENFMGNTLIAHSLLVSNNGKEDDQRQGHENFVDNDHKYSRDTWFGVLLQPDDRAFQSLKRLHEPLGNVCLQISPSVEDERSNCDESLECILGQHVSELPLDFDFLGLNEVGYGNYWLLRNFLGNSTYKPKVVCISYDNKRSNDVAYIPDQTNDQELPSIRAVIELMSCHDYQLAATTSRCCFFSTRELYEGYLIGEPPTVSQYRNPIDDSYVEQEEKRESSESDHETKSDKIGLETSYSSNPTLSGNTMDDNNKQHSFQTKECDDFVCVSPNTSAAHQDIENAEFVGRRQTEAKETINTKHFKDERISQRFPAKLKKAVPPHPIRDTFILQKMKQNELTGDKSLEETRMESKNEIEIRKEAEKELATVFAVIQDSLSESMDGSVLDLENEMFKLLQDNKKEKADAIYEELGCASNGNDDDFLPMSVPTDLTALCGPTERSSQKERLECAKSLIAELRHKGHAMVCGTTISRFVCRDALYASHLMFYEADESVRISCKSENGILRGYSPKCTEQSGSSNLKDMVRKFRLGSEKGTTPNKWPVEGTLDEETDEYIRVSFQKYHDNLHRVAVLITKSIHEIISSDVTAPNNAHDPNAHDPNSSLLTLINCEHGSRHDTRKPLIAGHNDTSIVTILLVDGGDCANIQHESTEGKWENVKLPEVIPKDPVFMVYAGECLQKLSGGLIPSNSRRIVPCFGDQIVNGLSFSLMLSETHTSPFQNKEPTNAGHEDFQSPVSKPMCELNDVGEDFQSSVFSENGDFEHDSSFQENSEVTVDPFTQDLEDVRKMRRHHIEGSRSAKRNSRAIDQILSKYRNQSSKMGEFEGQEVEINEEIPINSCLESSRPGRNHFSTKLLGSPQLPIIIETQTKSARRTDSSAKKTIKIDENFKPMPPFPTCGKNAKRNCESIDEIKLLPVVSPRNPPRRELKELRNEYRKTYICTMNTRKSSGGDNRTKDRFIGSRINVVHQINPVESSEASAILEEMLEYESDDHSNNVDRQMARARSRIKSDSKVVPSSSSQKYDEIFKTWRDSLSDNYTPFRGSVVELKMGEKAKKIQSSSSRWEKRGYRFGCGVAKQDP